MLGKERSSQPPTHPNYAKSTDKPKNRLARAALEEKFFKWKAGQINVQSGSDDFKTHFILDDCKKANLDVVCMQEVRRIGNDSLSYAGYDFYWCGKKLKRKHGVGIAVKKSKDIVVNNVLSCSPRLMAMDVTICGCKIRVISAYAPTENSVPSSKQTFYRELKKLCVVEQNRKICINGDFNATTSIGLRHSCFDGRNDVGYEDDISNDNGERFLEFCKKEKFSILNTWFQHPLKHRFTWHSPDQVTKKVIDYSVSDSWLRQFVTDVRVYNSYFESDHRLLVTRFRTPANKAARFHIRKARPEPKVNLLSLNEENHKVQFSDTLKKTLMLSEDKHSNVSETHNIIVSSLATARDSLPKLNRKKTTNPWDENPQLKELISQRDQQKRSKNGRNVTTILSKKIRKLVDSLRNAHLKDIGSKINEAKQSRFLTEMWRKAKEHDNIIKSKPKQIPCPGLKDHFQHHFNPDHSTLKTPNEIEYTPEYIKSLQTQSLAIDNNAPSEEEVLCAVKKLKSNKSSIDIEGEVLKAALDVKEFLQMFSKFIVRVWNEKNLPDQWSITRITALWKQKGSSQDPLMYRGISIGSIVVKVVMNIILSRSSQFYESQLLNTQFGFRSGKGCNDGIYVMKQLQEVACRSKRKLYTCYVDLSSAYDHINRKLLFSSIRNRIPPDQPTDCIDILENLYGSTKSFMSGEDQNKDAFETSSGVRQGGNESPNLFNLYMDYALRVYKARCDAAGLDHLDISYTIPNECTNRDQRSRAPSRGKCTDDDSGYADDLGIHAWSSNDLEKRMVILHAVFKEFGLIINMIKTETMIWNWDDLVDGPYPENILSINGFLLNNVKHFKYLGVWNTYNDIHIGEKEVNNRKNSANGAFAQHRKMLGNKNIHLATRVMFMNSLVRSRLTYGCHAWRPTQSEMSKLSSRYKYFLRCMVYNGFKRVCPPEKDDPDASSETVDWRYVISDDKLLQITKCIPLEQYYQVQQKKWVAHITRRENDDVVKVLTFHDMKVLKVGRPVPSILQRVIAESDLDRAQFLKSCFMKTIL